MLKKRYLARDADGVVVETPEDLFHRVAHSIAAVECDFGATPEEIAATEQKFYRLLGSMEFLPNSPTIRNAGRTGTLSGCFVVPIGDSMEEICEARRQAAFIMKYGGGVGYDFTKLRPAGSLISSTHKGACGPVRVMRDFSLLSDTFTQGAGAFRTGAQMQILHCNHPDIFEFIHCKDTGDDAGITHANISVGITDEFITALHGGGKSGHFNENDRDFTDEQGRAYGFDLTWGGRIYQTIDARKLWKEIAESAWKTGDPGLFFVDRANGKANPISHITDISATNPCVTGDTVIATLEGPKRIDSLEGNTLVYAWNPKTKQPAVKWMRNPRKTRENVPVLKITFDSGLVVRCTHDHHFYSFRGTKVKAEELKWGKSIRAFAVSQHRDGHLRAHAGDSSPKFVARLVYEECVGQISENQIVHHSNHNCLDNTPENLELLSKVAHNQEHYQKRHANGLDGWKPGEMSDTTRAIIAEGNRLAWKKKKVTKEIGNHRVVKIEEDGYADVYNGTVDDVHTYIICDPNYRGSNESGIFSGIVSANCGEQSLEPYGSCNLGSIDLAKFVDLGIGSFDWTRLEDCITLAVRFLDDVVQVNPMPTPETSAANKLSRRIGLGIMGWADALVLLKIPYASEEALTLAEKVIGFIRNVADSSSIKLGMKRGTYGAFDGSRHQKEGTPFRNAFRLSIQPTGTTSIIADCSSGIEPIFALEWIREMEDNDQGGGNKTAELMEYHPAYKAWLDSGGNSSPKKFQEEHPYVQISTDIAPEWHVRMQAAFQKYVDNGISKTVILPNSATVEDVFTAYNLALELGCKGITVYRTGSREVEVLRTKDETSSVSVAGKIIPTTIQRTRLPDERPSITHKFSVDGQEGYLTIGMYDDGRPGEMFASVSKQGSMTRGLVDVIAQITSIALQYGVPLEALASKLKGSRFEPHGMTTNPKIPIATSIPDYIFRYMEQKFLNQEAIVPIVPAKQNMERTGYGCPECGGTLYHAEGCLLCRSCGYSKCG